MNQKDFHRRIRSFLLTIKADDIDFTVSSNGHVRCTFTYQEREFVLYCPGSPSDVRSHKNAIAQIKRMISAPDRRNVQETLEADIARIEQVTAPLPMESGSFFRRKLAEMARK